jgi:hypothetical protein
VPGEGREWQARHKGKGNAQKTSGHSSRCGKCDARHKTTV